MPTAGKFLGAVMKNILGIALLGVRRDVLPAPDLSRISRLPGQLYQNIIVGHLTPYCRLFGHPTTTFGVHTTTDILNPCRSDVRRSTSSFNQMLNVSIAAVCEAIQADLTRALTHLVNNHRTL